MPKASQHWQVESNNPSIIGQALRPRKELLKLFEGRRDSPPNRREPARSPEPGNFFPQPQTQRDIGGFLKIGTRKSTALTVRCVAQPQTRTLSWIHSIANLPTREPLEPTPSPHSAKPRNQLLLPPEVTALTGSSFQPSHNGEGTDRKRRSALWTRSLW